MMDPTGHDASTIFGVLEVFRTLHRLKELPRQGFVYFGFKGDETDSIGEHSFMVAWLTYLLGCEDELSKQDIAKATLMALVHDWGEAVAGDLSYRVKGDAFADTEKAAFYRLVKGLRNKKVIEDLWEEYKAKTTRLAAVVKLADALDAWLQGLVTTTTWWPAWEDYNRSVFHKLHSAYPGLAAKFRRICDLARDPNVQVWLPDQRLDAGPVWDVLRFAKQIYSLKELPRHGFMMFGMKRSETDSFAGHGFCTASLALLITLECFSTISHEELLEPVMVALCHDLPVALTGDAAYDLQRTASDAWYSMSREAIRRLVESLPCGSEVAHLHEMWLRRNARPAWIVKVAAAVDAWEMGVTTPSSWMGAWMDYRQSTLESLRSTGGSVDPILRQFLEQAYEDLLAFDDVTLENGSRVGMQPKVRLIRLT